MTRVLEFGGNTNTNPRIMSYVKTFSPESFANWMRYGFVDGIAKVGDGVTQTFDEFTREKNLGRDFFQKASMRNHIVGNFSLSIEQRMADTDKIMKQLCYLQAMMKRIQLRK